MSATQSTTSTSTTPSKSKPKSPTPSLHEDEYTTQSHSQTPTQSEPQPQNQFSHHQIKVRDFAPGTLVTSTGDSERALGLERKRSLRKRIQVLVWNPRAKYSRRGRLMELMGRLHAALHSRTLQEGYGDEEGRWEWEWGLAMLRNRVGPRCYAAAAADGYLDRHGEDLGKEQERNVDSALENASIAALVFPYPSLQERKAGLERRRTIYLILNSCRYPIILLNIGVVIYGIGLCAKSCFGADLVDAAYLFF
ncbi:hypothetical protein DL98DRAFT_588731 [Cadophora sp. DSE1049]|nr:hypothetical protein DL98DRAFT_588731 [Cadophora sp. DSE1049]